MGALSNAQTESTSNKAESDSNALIPLYSLSTLLDMDSYFLALCGNHHFGVFRLFTSGSLFSKYLEQNLYVLGCSMKLILSAKCFKET